MATDEHGREIMEVRIWDQLTERPVERMSVRGDIYRHVLIATDMMQRQLVRDLERGTLSPPSDRYEVQWVIDEGNTAPEPK